MTSTSLWLPIEDDESRVLTSARLDEGVQADHVTLYVLGDRAAEFDVPAGLGKKLLAECGMALEQP
jgi:hypothetical protein